MYIELLRQGSEWLEVREKVEQEFSQIANGFLDKIDMVSDELISRIYEIRNRQDEVRIKVRIIRERYVLHVYSLIRKEIFNGGSTGTRELSRRHDSLGHGVLLHPHVQQASRIPGVSWLQSDVRASEDHQCIDDCPQVHESLRNWLPGLAILPHALREEAVRSLRHSRRVNRWLIISIS